MNKHSWLLVAAAFLVIGVGVWYWYAGKKEEAKPIETVEQALEAVTEAPAASAIKEATTNPVGGNLPELNPVEKVNPFKYQNPFE